MQSLTLRSRIDENGILRLETPIGMPNTEVEVVLVVDPLEKHSNWPPGFFTEVIGGWQGEPLVREPQGEYETRDELK